MEGKESVVAALKVEKNRFFVLGVGEERWVYALEDEAMNALAEKFLLGDDVGSEDVWVVKVHVLKRKWRVEELPWSKMVLDLVRLGGFRKKE